MGAPVAGVGRLDQRFQHVERGALDTVTEQKLLGFRETLDRLHQPVDELEVGLHGGTCAASVVGHSCSLTRVRRLGACSVINRAGYSPKKNRRASGGSEVECVAPAVLRT